MLAKITMTLIVPLVISIIVLMHIITRFFQQIEKSPIQVFIDMYESHYDIQLAYHFKILVTVLLYRVLYITFSMATITFFYLLSKSLIIASASLNMSKNVITYLKAIKFIPMIRLTVTFICMFWMLFTYTVVSWVMMIKLAIITINTIRNDHARLFIISLLLSTYCLGFLYLGSVSQLACVISTLEPFYGIEAMIKGTRLVKGNTGAALFMSFLFNVQFFVLGSYYLRFDLDLIGVIILVLPVIGFLLNMVIVQTNLYLACKAHHGENIDLEIN